MIANLRFVCRRMNALPKPHVPQEPDQARQNPASLPSEVAIQTWDSTDLLGKHAEALILHRGQHYRLRCTKQGKLILYK